MKEIEIVLGKTYRDTIFGIEGIATAHCKYITGCDHIRLDRLKDEKVESEWFDIARLEVVKKKVVSLKKTSKVGGPASHPPKISR